MFIIYVDSLEPYEEEGGGELVMFDVKKIAFTEAFYEHSVKMKICQNKDGLPDCSLQKLMDKLLQECICIPFELIGMMKEIGENMCNQAGRDCSMEIINNKSLCSTLLKQCGGLYFDIKRNQYKSSSFVTKNEMEASSMINQYQQYKEGNVGNMLFKFRKYYYEKNDKMAIQDLFSSKD